MIDPTNNRIQLSDSGQRRRKQMLEELQGELKRSQIRRQRLNGLAVVAGSMLILGVSAWIYLVTLNHSDYVVDQRPRKPTTRESDSQANRIDIADASLKDNNPPLKRVVFETIDDEEMLQTLSDLGHPAVLGRVGGKLTIVPQKRM